MAEKKFKDSLNNWNVSLQSLHEKLYYAHANVWRKQPEIERISRRLFTAASGCSLVIPAPCFTLVSTHTHHAECQGAACVLIPNEHPT